MTATFETLRRIDALLSAGDVPPLTSWWALNLERLYAHPTATTLVARVGRGGAKSHTSAKVSLNEVLFGDWKVPPGERHLWAFVSLNKDEAAQRLLLLERFLTILGIGHDRKGDEIHLHDLPRGWRVMACQVGSVSGFRCFGRSLDELAKWRNSEGANPANEVSASTAAQMVTHPGARSLLISSPLGTLDYHAERFALGDTAEQLTCSAPSWVANPDGITEAQTHQLEPDRRVWLREYAAIPQAQFGSAFDPELVAACFRTRPSGRTWQPIGITDASSGGGDAFSFAVASYVESEAPHHELLTVFSHNGVRIHPDTGEPLNVTPEPPRLVVHFVDSFEGRFKGEISASEIITKVSQVFLRYGVQTVIGDQREAFFVASEFSRHRLQFREIAWTNSGKIEAVRVIREHMARRSLVLPEREKLKRELLSYAERITATGSITYAGRGSHDDEASLILTLAMAELERLVPGSPLAHLPGRTEVPGR